MHSCNRRRFVDFRKLSSVPSYTRRHTELRPTIMKALFIFHHRHDRSRDFLHCRRGYAAEFPDESICLDAVHLKGIDSGWFHPAICPVGINADVPEISSVAVFPFGNRRDHHDCQQTDRIGADHHCRPNFLYFGSLGWIEMNLPDLAPINILRCLPSSVPLSPPHSHSAPPSPWPDAP
jgi:hypothetical protein